MIYRVGDVMGDVFNSVSLKYAYRLLHPKLTALIACYDEYNVPNAMTAAWIMPVSVNPPLIVVSISPKRYTYELILKAKIFSVNIPSLNMLKKVHLCGTISGREIKNKLKRIGLTTINGRKLNVPIIEECIAFLECKLWENIVAGDHNLIIGKIIDAYVRDNIFDVRYDISKISLIYHCGGNIYTKLTNNIVRV